MLRGPGSDRLGPRLKNGECMTLEQFTKLVNRLVMAKTCGGLTVDDCSDFMISDYYNESATDEINKAMADDCAIDLLNNQCLDLNMSEIF